MWEEFSLGRTKAESRICGQTAQESALRPRFTGLARARDRSSLHIVRKENNGRKAWFRTSTVSFSPFTGYSSLPTGVTTLAASQAAPAARAVRRRPPWLVFQLVCSAAVGLGSLLASPRLSPGSGVLVPPSLASASASASALASASASASASALAFACFLRARRLLVPQLVAAARGCGRLACSACRPPRALPLPFPAPGAGSGRRASPFSPGCRRLPGSSWLYASQAAELCLLGFRAGLAWLKTIPEAARAGVSLAGSSRARRSCPLKAGRWGARVLSC